MGHQTFPRDLPDTTPGMQTRLPAGVSPRRGVATGDYRLNMLLNREPVRCASIGEYATAAGMEPDEVIEALTEHLAEGSARIEVHGDDLFLHTAPAGRPAPAHLAEIPANLWEMLRARHSVPHAHQMWRLTRALEAAGWRVEHRPAHIMFGLGPMPETPQIAVEVGHRNVPLILFPQARNLTAPGGILDVHEQAGAPAAGIVCAKGALDQMAGAVRTWMLTRPIPPAMSIMILESPRFNPTLLSPNDAAVTPRAIAISTLTEDFWE